MNARVQRWILVGVLAMLFILSLAYFVYGNVQSGIPIGDLIANTLLLAVPLAGAAVLDDRAGRGSLEGGAAPGAS